MLVKMISKSSIFATIIVMALSAISASSVFAAPSSTRNNSLERAWGNQFRDLNAARDWYDSVRSTPRNFVNTSDPAKAQQYLSEYAFVLAQADAIVRSGGSSTTNDQSAQQKLAGWLHEMRGLQDKLSSIGFSNTSASTIASIGIPVTGGSSSSGTSNSATPSTSSSSSSSTGSAATPTATPSTSSSSNSGTGSAATPTATPNTSSSSSSNTSSAGVPVTGGQTSTLNNTALVKVWGSQFRNLEDARTWYNNFRSNAANISSASDPVKTQQWLAQYAFALRQATAIIGSGNTATTNNSNTNSQRTSAQQNLAMWLHMMRGLRDKILIGDTNSSNHTAGQ